MSRYFRLHVPTKERGKFNFYEKGYDLVFDRNNLNYVFIRDDGAAYVKVNGNDSTFVYKDEADRLLDWLEESE